MTGLRYRVTKSDTEKFQENLIQIMEQTLKGIITDEDGVEKLDEALCQRVQSAPHMEEIVEELHEALDKFCKSSFKLTRPTRKIKKAVQHKSVPWWTQKLTILRKKVNAHWRFQRT
jgi:hypothetical protein